MFQDFKLVNGTWEVMSPEGKLERVRPGDITTTAVMTVEGELDDISGAGQTRAALDMCSGVAASQKTHLEAKGAGHYGIFSGRRWRDIVYPAVTAFILDHHQPLAQNSLPAAAKKAAKPARKARVALPAGDQDALASAAAVQTLQAIAKPRAKKSTAGLKAGTATAAPLDMPAATAGEKIAPKPVLKAVKNAPSPVTAAAPLPTSGALAALPADVQAKAPDAVVDLPTPPEKSAA